MADKRALSPSVPGSEKKRPRSLSHPAEATTTIVTRPVNLELHEKPIKLSNAYHDSPMFRKSLLKEEEHATDLGTTLKSYAKCLRSVHASGTHHGQIMSTMTTEAQLLIRKACSTTTDSTELEFESQFYAFVQVILHGENLRTNMLKSFEEMIIKPVESLQDEITSMKEASKRWQRLLYLTDASASKVAGLKKNSNKLDESEAELAELKKQTATAAIEVGTSMNALAVKRRLLVLDSACRYLELQKDFLDEYSALMKDSLPELQACRSRIKAEMEDIPNALLRVPLAIAQDACISGYLQGYLYRKTKMNFTRRSYFILDNGIISCYEDLDSDLPKWKLDMLTCSVKPTADSTRNFCFDVISPNKTRTLQADSHETMNRWISALQEAISTQLDKQRISRPGRHTSATPSTSKANAEAAEEKKKREEAINSLYDADEGNRRCADCGDLNPTWISINLGILICLECSGIHRSMGTHISKVRSLNLDSLHHETKHYILELGNRRVNQVFGPDVLTAIPNSFGERLNPTSTRKDREAWIKAKYAEKIFVETYRGPSMQIDLVAAIRQQNLPQCLLLYAQGANLNFKYESDASRQPLHYAADSEDSMIIMFLLQNGAHVNATDANGNTPLHIAATGHVACAAMLCRFKAKVEAQDHDGKTPVDIALTTQNADVITLLRLAKLAREGGDEKSFAEALDSFTADLSKLRTSSSSSSSSSSAPSSSPGPLHKDFRTHSEGIARPSGNADSPGNNASRHPSSHHHHHTSSTPAPDQPLHTKESTTLASSSSSSSNSNSDIRSSAGSNGSSSATSSFSFSSKLDTKRR